MLWCLFSSVDGHDSKEDALACLDIMKAKVTGEVSEQVRGVQQIISVLQVARLQAAARANNTSKRRDAYLTNPDNVVL